MPRDNSEFGDGQYKDAISTADRYEYAVSNPMPKRKPGQPRKAVNAVTSTPLLPFGVSITETPQETAAGGGQCLSDAHIGGAFPSQIGSDAVADEAGQTGVASHFMNAPSPAPQSQTPAELPVGGGPAQLDDQVPCASPLPEAIGQPADGGKRRAIGGAKPNEKMPDLATLINDLIMEQKKRRFLIKSLSRANNSTAAFVRLMLGWRPDMDEKEAADLKAMALSIIQSVEKGKPLPGNAQSIADQCAKMILAAKSARQPLDQGIEDIEKNMVRLAKLLPVWSWVNTSPTAKGFAALSLAVVVGEAGDLSNFANPGKLWKRFGLAPYGGKACASWRTQGGLSASDWIELGYSPARRSEMWNRGVFLIMAQVRGEKDADGKKTGSSTAIGPLGQIYLDRKVLELTKGITPKHAHNRAQRYIEKRLLRDLWRAWRDSASLTNGVNSAKASQLVP